MQPTKETQADLYQRTHFIDPGEGGSLVVEDDEDGWISIHFENEAADLRISLKRKAAARLLADLSAVITLCDMADESEQDRQLLKTAAQEYEEVKF